MFSHANIETLQNVAKEVLMKPQSHRTPDEWFLLGYLKEDRLHTAIETATAEEVDVPDDLNESSAEKLRILEMLMKNNWSQQDAAEDLGMPATMLNRKIRKYGITSPDWKKNKPKAKDC